LNGGTEPGRWRAIFDQEIDMPTKKAKVKKPASKTKAAAKKTVKAPARKQKPAAKKAAAKKTVIKKKTPVKKATPKKAPAKKKAVAKKAPPKKKAVAKKAPAKKKAVAKKAPAKKKVVAKKTPAESKAVAKKPPAAPNRQKKSDKKVARAVGELQRFDDFKPYKPSRGESYMNDEQLEHFKQLLYVWRAELVEEMTRTVSHMKDEAANFPDPADRATQEEEFSLELRTRDRERKLIKKIDGTLERIKIDDYGYCDACGIEIGIQRLEARPTATLCIDCKTLAEIKERQELG
jgi:DnaK suppressor protein